MEPALREALRAELAPTGALRTAINLGNPVLAGRDARGELTGVSVDLAREIARRLELPLAFTPFDAAVKVFEAVGQGGLDLVFLARDPVRAKEILFTPPYVTIEGTYLVREASPLRDIPDFDRAGVRIAVGRGAAYDLFLTRHLTKAELVRAGTSGTAVTLFLEQGLEAAAGVRQPLERFTAGNAGFRVIPGAFTEIQQAVGTVQGRTRAGAWLSDVVEELKASGFVAAALARHGQDASVAPPWL